MSTAQTTSPNATVTTHIDGRGVATVTLNNPEKYNAFDDAIIAELITAFAELHHNPGVRVMVLASTGKCFSSGADLAWMKRMATFTYDQNLTDAGALAEMLRALNSLPFSTIARVQGAAYGGAVGLVSCCDLAVASPQASFCLSEVKIGLIPATIGPYVINAIGQRAARRYFTTAEIITADKALALGLVSELVDADELDVRVDQLIDTLLANSPAAVRAAKQLVSDVAGMPITADLITDTCQRIAAIRVSTEGQDGLGAFFEKRLPSWRSDV